jgi:hypothetical protein
MLIYGAENLADEAKFPTGAGIGLLNLANGVPVA